MKTGIYVRVGKENYDLVDLLDDPLFAWVESLKEDAKTRTIIYLISLLRNV